MIQERRGVKLGRFGKVQYALHETLSHKIRKIKNGEDLSRTQETHAVVHTAVTINVTIRG